MNDISDLEQRINAALDRIGAGIRRIGEAGDDDLASALEAERTANAQLEARVKAIKETQETTVAALEAEVAALKSVQMEQDADVQRLRSVNAQLRDTTTALREANAAGLADPHLVNKSMTAELEALRSAMQSDRSEMKTILDSLDPILAEASNA
jgi:chromosome segregation ATPase